MERLDTRDYVPECAGGERCSMCGKPATRKVCEHIFDDDPHPIRHEFTAYVCLDHFNQIMDRAGYTRPTAPNELAELRKKVEGMRKPLSCNCGGRCCEDSPIIAHNAAIDLALAEIDKMRGKGA